MGVSCEGSSERDWASGEFQNRNLVMSSEVETSLIVVLRRLLRLILKSDLWISGFFSSSFYFVPSELFPVVQRIERRLSFERVLISFVHEHCARDRRGNPFSSRI